MTSRPEKPKPRQQVELELDPETVEDLEPDNEGDDDVRGGCARGSLPGGCAYNGQPH